ncbi:hypothetical protein PV327_009998 [Microctonus hyperodae]|uniref:Uncharacterized protein n=1 Tax=Microctonus hyperodae TaxID=165561 RepID=A0AA39F255_MICHY|nr:hypothetical protein PV327_009998 [Microctonus hyperodae]
MDDLRTVEGLQAGPMQPRFSNCHRTRRSSPTWTQRLVRRATEYATPEAAMEQIRDIVGTTRSTTENPW